MLGRSGRSTGAARHAPTMLRMRWLSTVCVSQHPFGISHVIEFHQDSCRLEELLTVQCFAHEKRIRPDPFGAIRFAERCSIGKVDEPEASLRQLAGDVVEQFLPMVELHKLDLGSDNQR